MSYTLSEGTKIIIMLSLDSQPVRDVLFFQLCRDLGGVLLLQAGIKNLILGPGRRQDKSQQPREKERPESPLPGFVEAR